MNEPSTQPLIDSQAIQLTREQLDRIIPKDGRKTRVYPLGRVFDIPPGVRIVTLLGTCPRGLVCEVLIDKP